MSDEQKVVEVPAKFQALVSEIEKMSVLDLSELVKVLEGKFGVSAAAPIMAVSSGPSAGSSDAPVEEKTSFTVELTETGSNKIGAIKVLREVLQMGLKDAKDLVDAAPKVIKEGADKAQAEELKKKLEDAGAKVVLK